MDFICELIFDIILEGVFGITIKNPKLGVWTKTICFLLFSEAIASIGALAAIQAKRAGNLGGAVVCGITALGLGILFLFGAVYSHKRGWKGESD